MVKLFFQVPYPFQTAGSPFKDNFGETSLIFQRPRLRLKLLYSSQHPPHSNHSFLFHTNDQGDDPPDGGEDNFFGDDSHIIHAMLAAPYP